MKFLAAWKKEGNVSDFVAAWRRVGRPQQKAHHTSNFQVIFTERLADKRNGHPICPLLCLRRPRDAVEHGRVDLEPHF